MFMAYILLILLACLFIYYSLPLFTFYYIYYPESLKEYKITRKKIKDVNSTNYKDYNKNLKYCIFKNTGIFFVDKNNNRSFIIRLISPYNLFLEDQKKYPDIKMATWFSDHVKYKNEDKEPGPQGNINIYDLSKETIRKDTNTSKIEIIDTTYFPIV